MPDPMSPDPEVVALAAALWDTGAFDMDRDAESLADAALRALHAAGYRVVRYEETRTATLAIGAAFPRTENTVAAPTEEERQHETP